MKKVLLPDSPHVFVLLQAVLGFHRQVSNVVSHVSDQYNELFGATLPSEACSREQMMVQLMGSLNVSGRYFAFKEQMKVRKNGHVSSGKIKLS